MRFFGGTGAAMMAADEDAKPRDPFDEKWWGANGARSEINVKVTIPRARQVPVIRSCLSLLSNSVAGLEHSVFQRSERGLFQPVAHHPISKLMKNPNKRFTSFDFIYTIVDDLCTEGDFFAEKIYNLAGVLTDLWRIEPWRVTVEETMDGTKRFRFTDRFGKERILLEDEVWHIPLPPVQGELVGTSPILTDGKEAVAVAIALQRYSNILFTNDATPPYALSMEGNFADPGSRKNMIKAIRKWMTGKNRHIPGILEYNMKPHRMGLTAEEAQFLETRKELWLDLARLWRVPPHKVGLLDKATFSNIEHQSLEFVTDTLRPILELIERSVNKFLIGDDNFYFEFNVESLLRGDIKSRYEAYSIGRQWGWLSVNDILKEERRNGIGPAGDRYVEPLNMVPVGTGHNERERDKRASIDSSIEFLHGTVGGRRRLFRKPQQRMELIQDAA